MYLRKISSPVVVCLLIVVAVLYSFTASGGTAITRCLIRQQVEAKVRSVCFPLSPAMKKLWKKALEIHRKAIVIDTHNDITTAMTNDDYDLAARRQFLIAPASSA